MDQRAALLRLHLGPLRHRRIQVKKVFAPVIGIVAHPAEGTVEFEVGFLAESLPVSLFETIPACRAKAACRGAAGLLPLPDVIPISEVELESPPSLLRFKF